MATHLKECLSPMLNESSENDSTREGADSMAVPKMMSRCFVRRRQRNKRYMSVLVVLARTFAGQLQE